MKKLAILILSFAPVLLSAQTTPAKKPATKSTTTSPTTTKSPSTTKSQSTTKATTTTKSPATTKPVVAFEKPGTVKLTQVAALKTMADSVSYAIGCSSALSAKQDGLPALKAALLAKGIEDVQSGKQPLLDDMTGYNTWMRFNALVKEKKYKPTVAKVAPTAKKPLVTLLDSVSYAVGVNRAMFAQQQGITNINTALFAKGVTDIQGNKKALIDEQDSYVLMNTYITKLQEEKSLPVIKEGEDFLVRNKDKAGVTTTPSGLQYEVIKEGTGIKPTLLDTFVAHYRGTLLNGTQFDASYDRNEPLKLGMTQVIRGWTEVLQLMSVGSKYKAYIPYTIAYGPYDNGQIPGGSMLIFEMELLDVIKPKQ